VVNEYSAKTGSNAVVKPLKNHNLILATLRIMGVERSRIIAASRISIAIGLDANAIATWLRYITKPPLAIYRGSSTINAPIMKSVTLAIKRCDDSNSLRLRNSFNHSSSLRGLDTAYTPTLPKNFTDFINLLELQAITASID
ncbi:MAG: hypothetical protein JHC33_06950, partial [Ignisphaera sp.]|nr:hypothetical protein [Ignisphaera sp.]